MALVTIQRSPSPSVEQDLDATDSTDDAPDGRSQMRKRSRTTKQKLRKILSSVRFISKLIRPGLSQSYFTVKGAALILPHTEFTKKSARKSHGGEIQQHLQAMLHLLRPEDTIKIAVRLEDINQYQRYMALVSTKGRQDTEEAVILGIDCSNSRAFIGLVLPVWMGLKITLGGDGGFSLCTDEQCYLFKPVSVQAMWSAIQSLVKVQHIADDMKYIRDGLTHTWVSYYRSRIDRKDSARVSQWNPEGVEVFAPSSLSIQSNDDERIKLAISHTLKEVMMTVDLDEATSLMLRKAVEEKMNLSLADFKGYFDEEVMRILGQMDEPSEILDYLFLGSEWNASNLEELLGKGIDYILNVTKEIDNFFEGRFHYYNVRVTDEDTSDLLKHWDKTYRFISKARSQKSKVLVHCKMGVSRSASTVMAFLMKERRWTVEEAFKFVKERRGCVHPNAGFMEQLQTYQGILTASNKRDIFRSKSDQNLLDDSAKDDLQLPDMSFLGGDLFHMMSHSDWLSASGGVAPGEEWFGSLYQDELQLGADLETECRSADSMEEVLPDLPSPPPETASHECLSLSLLSTRASCEQSSCDTGVTQETEASSETQSDKSGWPQASVGSPTLKIKPDSSWIRLDIVDTEEESNCILNSKLMLSETVPCSDCDSSTDLLVGALDSALKDCYIPDSSDFQETTVTEPHTTASQSHMAASSDSQKAAICKPKMANAALQMAATEPPTGATVTQWEMSAIHRAASKCDREAMGVHEAATGTHGTVVSQSELLPLAVSSRQQSDSTPTAAASNPSSDLDIPSLDVSLTEETDSQTEVRQTSWRIAATVPPDFIGSSCDIHGQKYSATAGSSGDSREKITSQLVDSVETVTSQPVDSVETVTSQPVDSVEKITSQSPADEHEGMELSSSVDVTPESAQLHPSQPHRDLEELMQPSHLHGDLVELIHNTGLEDAEEVSELEVVGSGSASSSPHSGLDLGIQQIFFRENIPWKPGKVKKIQSDFNKTGQISQEGEAEDMLGIEVCQVAPSSLLDVNGESQTSAHPQATVLHQSHSCMEMCSQEEDNLALGSLYEREKIPLTPGIVLRTKQEIEARHCSVSDQEPHPMLRTSSLKHHRDSPYSKSTHIRRSSGPVLTLQEGKCVGEAQSIGFGEIQQTDMGILEPSQLLGHLKVMPDSEVESKFEIDEMLQQISSTVGSSEAPTFEPVASPSEGSQVNLERSETHSSDNTLIQHHPVFTETKRPQQISGTVESSPTLEPVASLSAGNQVNLERSETHSVDNTLIQHHPVFTESQNQPMTKGNLASETLALIREIGSALLMSPTPHKSEDNEENDESRPRSNMVRYFVRKIEQQTEMTRPPGRTVVACRKSVSSEFDESGKIITPWDDTSPCAGSPIFSILNSPTRSRQAVELLSGSAPCTSKVSSHFGTKPGKVQDFTDTLTSCTSQPPSYFSTKPDTVQDFTNALTCTSQTPSYFGTKPETAQDFTDTLTSCTSQPPSYFTPETAEDFTNASTFNQSSDEHGVMNSAMITLNVAATSPRLVEAPSLVVDSQHDIVPQSLPLSKMEPAISSVFEPLHSPSLSLQHESSLSLQHEPSHPLKHEPSLPFQHEPSLSLQHESSLPLQHEPSLSLQHESSLSLQHEPSLSLQHESSLSLQHEPSLSLQHEPSLSFQYEPSPSLQHEPTETVISPTFEAQHSPSSSIHPDHMEPNISTSVLT